LKKHYFLLVLIIIVYRVGYSQLPIYQANNCYFEKIKLHIKDKAFKDTIMLFRNYIDFKDDIRLLCRDKIADKNLEDLIWGCKYISEWLRYQQRLNKFSFVSFRTQNSNDTIAIVYICDRKTRETIEKYRFRIVNKMIIGINILPDVFDGFVPIEEFEDEKYKVIEI